MVNDIFGGSLYRFRTYGATVSASYPFDRFNRIEFGFNWYNVLTENMDYRGCRFRSGRCSFRSSSYTHDTSLWGFTSPVTGTRYRVDLFGTPRLGPERA